MASCRRRSLGGISSSADLSIRLAQVYVIVSWRFFDIVPPRLTAPKSLSTDPCEAESLKFGLEISIGPEIMGLVRGSPSLAGVLRPKKLRKWEPVCDELSCSLEGDGERVKEGEYALREAEVSKDAVDKRLALAEDCLYAS